MNKSSVNEVKTAKDAIFTLRFLTIIIYIYMETHA